MPQKKSDIAMNGKLTLIPGIKGYGASKTAQLMFMYEIADELKDRNLTLVALHPGSVKSNIGINNGWLYGAFSKHIVFLFLKPLEIFGRALHFFATSPDVQGVEARFYNQTNEETPAKHIRDRDLGKKVCRRSIELIEQTLVG